VWREVEGPARAVRDLPPHLPFESATNELCVLEPEPSPTRIEGEDVGGRFTTIDPESAS
jgi:hypothetical protein